MQIRSVTSTAGGDAVGEHGHDLLKIVLSQVAVWICAAEYVEQILLAPVVGRAHGNDLLRQHVEWSLRNNERVEFTGFDGPHQRSAFNEFVASRGKDAPFGNGSTPVPGAANALQHHGNRSR